MSASDPFNHIEIEMSMDKPKVGIACQGGGSHAAYSAGVLRMLLKDGYDKRFKLAAVSGTSGGAICAALTWAGLITGGPEDAIGRLDRFWADLAPQPHESLAQFWGHVISELPLLTEISPYLFEPFLPSRLPHLLETHLQLSSISTSQRATGPKIHIGATDVCSGERVIFDGERLTVEELLASAAVPTLFKAVPLRGTYFWDGLFATNPPIRELTESDIDELWVIQVNPQRVEKEPRTIQEIADRRNELSGNLSLSQELYFIDKINKLIKRYPELKRRARSQSEPAYKHITIRVLPMQLRELSYASKLHTSPEFIRELINHGEERALLLFDESTVWPGCGSIPKEPVRV